MAPARGRARPWALPMCLLLAPAVAGGKRQRPRAVGAVVAIEAPAQLKGPYLGFFGDFSPMPGPAERLVALAPEDEQGCGQGGAPAGAAGAVLLLRRGNCTFVQKAMFAQKAGARGAIVVGDSEDLMVMGGAASDGGNSSTEEQRMQADLRVFAVYVQRQLGLQMLDWVRTNGTREPLTVSVKAYEPQASFVEILAVLVGATSLVMAGAFFATADLRPGSPLAPAADEVLQVDSTMAMSFCVMGSVALVTLFFLMRFAIYVIMFSFCFGGATCILQLVSAGLRYTVPATRARVCTLPEVGDVVVADVIGLVPASILVVGWIVYRHSSVGWVFQDIIGAGFLCMMQRTLRLPNLKVSTLLLSAMFFFDIFWVFLSPLIFKKSVMIEVAKGAGTGEKVPMLMRIPNSDPLGGGEHMLGFGDIALPGLLISYLLRYDVVFKKDRCRGYFVPGVVGYFVGLATTHIVLLLTASGQPALLYLVPGTLGTTLALGRWRGELPQLWAGPPERSDSGEDAEVASNGGKAVQARRADLRPRREGADPERQKLTSVEPDQLGCPEDDGIL